MKLLIASTLASAAIGLATFASTDSAAPIEDRCPPCPLIEDCGASVECLPDGTCRVECEDSAGETCWAIIQCDESGGCEIIESNGDCKRLSSAKGDCGVDDGACMSQVDASIACTVSESTQACQTTCD